MRKLLPLISLLLALSTEAGAVGDSFLPQEEGEKTGYAVSLSFGRTGRLSYSFTPLEENE